MTMESARAFHRYQIKDYERQYKLHRNKCKKGCTRAKLCADAKMVRDMIAKMKKDRP